MTYRCIAQLQEKADNTALLCRLLGVSRSGFYAACSRRGDPARVCPTSTHLRAAFTASGRCYGSRRLRAVLHAQGLRVGRYRIRTLMRINGLRAVWRRKFIHTTDSRHGLPIADNVLNRHFTPATANAAWVSDITYIRTRSGWLYLAAVLDLYSRKIVGWAMAPNMPAELVCSALQMAITQRQPPAGLIVHSDRGPVRQRSPPCLAEPPWLDGQHEWQRQLLGQRCHGALLPQSEEGAGLAERLRQPRRGVP